MFRVIFAIFVLFAVFVVFTEAANLFAGLLGEAFDPINEVMSR